MSGLKPWERPSSWIPAVLIAGALNWYTFGWAYCWYGYEGNVGTGTSMSPNIHTGDDIFYVPWLYSVRDPARGDTVTFWARGWDGKQTFLLKRVVGLPGETVSVGNAQIRINGQLLQEDYVLRSWSSGSSYRSWTVPEGKYFMMGDNRGNSWDSRDFGYIEREELTPVFLTSSAIYQWRDALFVVWCGRGKEFRTHGSPNRDVFHRRSESSRRGSLVRRGVFWRVRCA